MKKVEFLLLVFIVSLCVPLFLFNSCTDDEFKSYNQTLLIASEIVERNDGNAFWVKVDGSNEWEFMYEKIANFNYEVGYEYLIEVRVRKIKNPAVDQSTHAYTLVKIISKVKKDSEVPFITTDFS